MTNYRPAPLLLLFPKYAKSYAQQLISEQCGFSKGITTEITTFRLTDCLQMYYQRNSCGRNFLWFGQGFWLCDSWNFLVHLRFYGIRQLVEDCFRCYVRNRRQKVEVTSPKLTKFFFSAFSTLKHGVLQGSILVSLLFIVYIDDLP